MRVPQVPTSPSFTSFPLTAGMIAVKPDTMECDRIELLGTLVLQSKGCLHLYYACLYR